MATICFLLVIALVLRTFVDSRYLDRDIGVSAGLVYAALLIVYGHLCYGKGKEIAPVYVICGLILALSITFEAHTRFDSLSTISSYMILGLLLIATSFTGFWYNVYAPVSAGVIGVCVCGIILDFPDPFFPPLAALLLLSNMCAFLAMRFRKSSGLSWFTFAVSAFFWLWWSTKVQTTLLYNETPSEALGVHFFLLFLLLFFSGYVLSSVLLLIQGQIATGLYGFVLPTANALGAYYAALTMVEAAGASVKRLALVFVVLAVGLIAFAVWLGRSEKEKLHGSVTFLSAGSILLLISLLKATGSINTFLLIWCFVALLLAVMGSRWRRIEEQVIGNLSQSIACLIALGSGLFASISDNSAGRLSVVSACGFVSLFHYYFVTTTAWRSCEIHSEAGNLFLRSNVLVLLTTLVYAFGGARMVLHTLLAGSDEDFANLYQCGLSILVNCGALLLLMLSLVKRNRELLSVSYLIAGVGALKVFGYDLFNTHDGPLVLSVLSSGIVATVSSFVWNRWQQEVTPHDSGSVGMVPDDRTANCLTAEGKGPV